MKKGGGRDKKNRGGKKSQTMEGGVKKKRYCRGKREIRIMLQWYLKKLVRNTSNRAQPNKRGEGGDMIKVFVETNFKRTRETET